MTFVVASTAFTSGSRIPDVHTVEGRDVSPPLRWSGAPADTVEFALICDDPDAPTPKPWVHWVIYRIPASLAELRAEVPRKERLTEPAGALQGRNSWPSDALGYRGPAPPVGHGLHHYHFKLYALGRPVDLGPGATKEELLAAMRGKVLAEGETVGVFDR